MPILDDQIAALPAEQPAIPQDVVADRAIPQTVAPRRGFFGLPFLPFLLAGLGGLGAIATGGGGGDHAVSPS
ncbi:MAG: hypothetical protein ABIQ32_07855 [Sphingomicrobium sp.]